MTRRDPSDESDEPPGGRARERLAEFESLRGRSLDEDDGDDQEQPAEDESPEGESPDEPVDDRHDDRDEPPPSPDDTEPGG